MMPPASSRAPRIATTKNQVEPSSRGCRNPSRGSEGGAAAGGPRAFATTEASFSVPHWMHSSPPAVKGARQRVHRGPFPTVPSTTKGTGRRLSSRHSHRGSGGATVAVGPARGLGFPYAPRRSTSRSERPGGVISATHEVSSAEGAGRSTLGWRRSWAAASPSAVRR